jgi:N-acetylmuramic acid 6-phosphate etherase
MDPDHRRVDGAATASTNPVPATELRHPGSYRLDDMSALEVVQLLHTEDRAAVAAVTEILPALATLVDAAVERIRHGGTVHYFGAGTSGRLGILDAAELIPTFNVPEQLVQAHLAGGTHAIKHSIEDAEDDEAAGVRDARALTGTDVAIGITASGRTPYVGGALREARSRGAYTALVTSNQASALAPLADVVIAPDTGPEVLTGSTRLKAATAGKIVLNGFSTALMVRLGRTYSNLMVSVVATNTKLRERTLRILSEVSGGDGDRYATLLDAAGGDLKVAIVSLLGGIPADESRRCLDVAGGSVRAALDLLPRQPVGRNR